MPIFVFNCTECNTQSERLVNRADNALGCVVRRTTALPTCPECGGALARDTKPQPILRGFGYSATGYSEGIKGGEVFTTVRDRDAYVEKYKITGTHDPRKGSGKMLREDAHHEADQAAKSAGYKDHRDYRKSKRREKAMAKGQIAPRIIVGAGGKK